MLPFAKSKRLFDSFILPLMKFLSTPPCLFVGVTLPSNPVSQTHWKQTTFQWAHSHVIWHLFPRSNDRTMSTLFTPLSPTMNWLIESPSYLWEFFNWLGEHHSSCTVIQAHKHTIGLQIWTKYKPANGLSCIIDDTTVE